MPDVSTPSPTHLHSITLAAQLKQLDANEIELSAGLQSLRTQQTELNAKIERQIGALSYNGVLKEQFGTAFKDALAREEAEKSTTSSQTVG